MGSETGEVGGQDLAACESGLEGLEKFSMSHQPIQTDWRLILLGFLVAGSIIYLLSGRCSGQTISQPVPQLSGNPGQLQQPQVYWVPTRAWTPVRNLLNAPPLFYWAPYTPVGAPYDAQVQPVVPYRRTW